MPAPSLTYTLTNGTTADATQVMQNFNDLLNGLTDATKDLSISALTAAGTATLNGHVNLGNSSSDDLTVTASLASNLVPKTDNTYNIGSAALGLAGVYLGDGGGDTARIVTAALSADRTYTLPDAGAAADFVMTAGAQTVGGAKTFSASPIIDLNQNGNTQITVKNDNAGSSAFAQIVFDTDAASNAAIYRGSAAATAAGGASSLNVGTTGADPVCLFTANAARITIAGTGAITNHTATSLGTSNTGIYIKPLSGTTGSSEGSTTNIAHGLTASKIIGIQCLIFHGASAGAPPNYTLVSEYEYFVEFTSTNIVVTLSATNSGNLLSKTIKVVVTYTD